MSEDVEQNRILEDWGSYPPETQKALRFITTLAGMGAAKQMAQAIDREYILRDPPRQTKTFLHRSGGDRALTYEDYLVLHVFNVLQRSKPDAEYEEAVAISRLSEQDFARGLGRLKSQNYIEGDAFFGYKRTKKKVPQPTKEVMEQIIEQIEDPFARRLTQKMYDTYGPGWAL